MDSVALLPSPCRLQGVLSIEPQNVRATSNLALIYLDLRNLEKSEQMFLRTLQIDPTYRSSIYNLGVLYNHQQRYGTFAWTWDPLKYITTSMLLILQRTWCLRTVVS